MSLFNAKEKFLIYNTLASVPIMLEGIAVFIDLRNETSVAGRIERADGFMNISLTEVVFIDRHGLQYEFDEFTVKSRFIRQIHIPESIDVGKMLQNKLENLGKRAQRKPTQTFKQKRAMQRHEKVLEEIAEKNKEQNKEKEK